MSKDAIAPANIACFSFYWIRWHGEYAPAFIGFDSFKLVRFVYSS